MRPCRARQARWWRCTQASCMQPPSTGAGCPCADLARRSSLPAALAGAQLQQASAVLCKGVSEDASVDRHMPGYPSVSRGNDTLLGRYDGSVIDAFPWQPAAAGPAWKHLLEVRPPAVQARQQLRGAGQAPPVLQLPRRQQ